MVIVQVQIHPAVETGPGRPVVQSIKIIENKISLNAEALRWEARTQGRLDAAVTHLERRWPRGERIRQRATATCSGSVHAHLKRRYPFERIVHVHVSIDAGVRRKPAVDLQFAEGAVQLPIESPGLGKQLGVVNGGDGRLKRPLDRKTLQCHGGKLILPDQSHTGQVDPQAIQPGILTGRGNVVELDAALFTEG